MRTRESVAGYVLTQLSDIEWEFNGLLDYLRDRKNSHDEFAAVNAPVTVVAHQGSHTCWDGESLAVDVVNDTSEELTGTIEWSLADQGGTALLEVPANGVKWLAEAVDVSPATGGASSRHDLDVTYRTDSRTVSTTEPVTAVSPEATTGSDRTVFADGVFASALASRGIRVTHSLDGADLVFTDAFTDDVEEFAADDGPVVHVPGSDGHMRNGGPFDYRDVPEREGWIEATSFLYQHSPMLEDVCDGPGIGWEFEGLYPFSVAIGPDPDVDEIHAGYVEGWLGNWSSPLVTRAFGSGSVTALTFRLRDDYGDHPLATLLCDRLIDRLIGDTTG